MAVKPVAYRLWLHLGLSERHAGQQIVQPDLLCYRVAGCMHLAVDRSS